jgi:hypothetical protein
MRLPGVAALDALRARFDKFAALVVHHEGHLKGRGRGWSGLRAAVDVEIRVERGKDDLLRLECTKSKDTKPMEPMAFQFAGVELGLKDDDGNPVTSAVLNEVDWTPAQEAKPKKAMGKNQRIALEALERLEKTGGNVTVDSWRDECKKSGIANHHRFGEAKNALEKNGAIKIDCNLVSSAGTKPGAEGRPLLYSGPSLSSPPGAVETTDSSLFRPSSLKPDIPEDVSPEEYQDAYNTAVSVFLKEGSTPQEADQKARAEIQKYIDGMKSGTPLEGALP